MKTFALTCWLITALVCGLYFYAAVADYHAAAAMAEDYASDAAEFNQR